MRGDLNATAKSSEVLALGSAVGLIARGTFERRKRAQELSSAVSMLVQEDAHENESEHGHLTAQPLQWLAAETQHTPSGRELHSRSKCSVSTAH